MKDTEAETLVLFTKEKHAFKCVTYDRYPHCDLWQISPLNWNTENVTLVLFMRLQRYEVSEKADARASDFDILIFILFLVLCLET